MMEDLDNRLLFDALPTIDPQLQDKLDSMRVGVSLSVGQNPIEINPSSAPLPNNGIIDAIDPIPENLQSTNGTGTETYAEVSLNDGGKPTPQKRRGRPPKILQQKMPGITSS
jgi:hypothetical protein